MKGKAGNVLRLSLFLFADRTASYGRMVTISATRQEWTWASYQTRGGEIGGIETRSGIRCKENRFQPDIWARPGFFIWPNNLWWRGGVAV